MFNSAAYTALQDAYEISEMHTSETYMHTHAFVYAFPNCIQHTTAYGHIRCAAYLRIRKGVPHTAAYKLVMHTIAYDGLHTCASMLHFSA